MSYSYSLVAVSISLLTAIGQYEMDLLSCVVCSRPLPLSSLMGLTALKLQQFQGIQCGCAASYRTAIERGICAFCRLLPLSSLTGLTALKLQHCQGIRRGCDLAPLSLLTGLSMLNLSGCLQTEGAGISSLCTLTSLRCGNP
jgi:hypothetical protein